jgi:hypothetical protein
MGTIPLLFLGGLWIDMKCLRAFHNPNTLGNFFKYFVICTPHSLIHVARISIPQLFMIKSIPTGAPYVTLHIKIGWRKVNICGFSSGNCFFSCKFARSAEASKKHSKAVHMPEKTVINKIWFFLPVFDWLIIMIVQVVWYSSSHLFAVHVSVYGWDCKRANN